MKGLHMLRKPTPLWLSILILCCCFVAIGGAATTLYTGSFSVASGGTITDTNQTASTCARYNTLKQIVSAGSDCATLTSLSAVSPLSYNSGNGQFSISASPTFTNITATALITGNVLASQSSGATAGAVPPCYTSVGNNCGNSVHTVVGTDSFNLANNCSINTTCIDTRSISFSNSAVFGSGTTYACSASAKLFNGTNNPFLAIPTILGTTGFTVSFFAINGASTGNTVTYSYVCTGT